MQWRDNKNTTSFNRGTFKLEMMLQLQTLMFKLAVLVS
jgi:hypothetical protein